jgi:hypothetical protein
MERIEIRFLKSFCNILKEYQNIFDEHLDYNEEIIPHVLMSEITAKLVENFELGNEELVKKTLRFVDIEFKNAPNEIKNMITVSMLENFPSTGDKNFNIRNNLSDNLRKELEQVNY